MDVDSGQLAVEAMPLSSATPEPAGGGLDPRLGMEFATVEDAWIFYNAYARRVGFNTRISVYQRSRRDGSITARQFVCAREGFRNPRRKGSSGGGGEGSGESRRTRAVTRVGCKAMIRVKKQEDGRWIVSRLETTHNHEMDPPSRAHSLRSLRLLSDSGKKLGGSATGRYIEPARRNCAELGSGMQSIMGYLRRMQADDPGFFVAVQSDGDWSTGNVFWADARSRMAYKHFGDVVIFDTSCKASGYQIPLVSFTGVNHHCQPVLFGCALLVDVSESSLVWLFKSMLAAMLGRHPTAIVSEYNRVVESAIVQVFPQTRHRFCKWHIFKETQDKLSHVFRTHPTFQEELDKCINMADTISEFESWWEAFIYMFHLKDNEWLQSLYSCRNQWVPVYLRNTFFAEISLSGQCESRTSYFDGYVNEKTGSQTFIEHYEKALDGRYEKEVQADFDTIYSLPCLKTSLPMEKQAAEAYTRKIFTKFQEQLVESSSYTANKINKEGEMSTYRVAKFHEEHKAYTIMLNTSETKATCSCQMFEYSGILCRHILTVFSVTNVLSLPSHYILRRWTKHAKDGETREVKYEVVSDEANTKSQCNSMDSRQSLTWRYNSLCREAIKYAEDGSTSIDIFVVAMRALQEAKNKVNMAKKNTEETGQPGVFRNGILVSKEKDVQEVCISKEVKETGVNEDRSMTSYETRWAIIPKESKEALASQRDILFLQQPYKFVLVAPGLSNDSGPSNLLNATAPVTLNLPEGSLDESGPMLVNLPIRSIMKGDPKNEGTSSQLPQGCSIAEAGQANTNSGTAADVTSLNSTEPQLVAIPMAFLVPTTTNLTTPSSALTNCSTVGSQEVSQPVTTAQMGEPSGAQESQTIKKDPSGLSSMAPPINSIRAAAIAAGARIASPSVAASLMKAAQSKNAIHIKADGSVFARSIPGGGIDTSAHAPWSAGQNSPSSDNNGTVENVDGASTRDWIHMDIIRGEDQSPEERGLDFGDSEDDEDMSDADVYRDQMVGQEAE